MSDTTDIKSTLMYGTNNKIRPYFYAYQRSEEERKSSHNDSDLGGEIVGTEVTGTYRKVANSSLSQLVARFQIFRRLVKGKFDAYVL